jgi:hypothetical protein
MIRHKRWLLDQHDFVAAAFESTEKPLSLPAVVYQFSHAPISARFNCYKRERPIMVIGFLAGLASALLLRSLPALRS